jgi:tripartite-type tricarboxylate transporter receptor subunit TctC
MATSIYPRFILTLMLALFFLSVEDNSFGANFPEKTIKIIVAFGPGAGVDAEARAFAPYIQKLLGVSVVVENLPGADGKIGITKVWRSKPDGYTLLIHTTTMSMIGEYALNPEYRIDEFSHIFSFSLTNHVLMVHSEKWTTPDEFIKTAKQRTLSGGMAGRGSTSSLTGIILTDVIGIKVNWVPFDGGAEALTALAGNHIDFAIASSTTALPLAKAGRLRPLMVLANSKDVVFPNIPLARDLGYNFTVIPSMRGLDGPPKMDLKIIKILEEAFSKAIKEPGFLSWAEKRMLNIAPLNHVEYSKSLEIQRKAIERCKDFIKPEK